jgi:hypothetical protein
MKCEIGMAMWNLSDSVSAAFEDHNGGAALERNALISLRVNIVSIYQS